MLYPCNFDKNKIYLKIVQELNVTISIIFYIDYLKLLIFKALRLI